MPYTPKILVVDDEPRMRDSLNYLLRTEGYEIYTAECGKEAIDCFCENEFDVALLDMMLPDMNGLQIMDHINSHSPETLVIVITGNANLDSALGSLRRGAYDFLKKPFEYDDLLNTVHNALTQKRLRYEKENIASKLFVSEKRCEYLVHNSPDIIYTLDDEGRFTFINKSAERLIGCKVEDLPGNHYTMLVYEEDLDKAKHVFNERRTGNRAASGIELRLKNFTNGNKAKSKNGYVFIELKATGLYDRQVAEKEKAFLGTHGVARDVSERKKLERQLRQAYKMEAIGTLAGGIAHDFNNILMVIIGNIELAIGRIPDGNPAHKNLKDVQKASLRARDIVSQILNFARKSEVTKKSIIINDLIQDSIKFLRSSIPTDIEFRQNLTNEPHMIFAEPTQIHQVILNLVANAAHAMSDKGGILEISLDKVTPDKEEIDFDPEFLMEDYVRLTVKDTGCGIPPEKIERIFDPYFTTKEIGKGTGLGLSVVRGIVNAHNGSITVNSKVGKGTVFNIFLPAIESNADPEIELDEDFPTGSERILFVDDEESLIEVNRQRLELLGYQVETRTNPLEALDLFRSKPDQFDLVITDMTMPKMRGDTLSKKMKEIRPDIPIILCSGFSEKINEEKASELGISEFVMKPLTGKNFAIMVRRVLDQQKIPNNE